MGLNIEIKSTETDEAARAKHRAAIDAVKAKKSAYLRANGNKFEVYEKFDRQVYRLAAKPVTAGRRLIIGEKVSLPWPARRVR